MFLRNLIPKMQEVCETFNNFASRKSWGRCLCCKPNGLTFRKQNPIQEAEMSKREYVQANKEWLEAKSKEEGVKALSRGIYYKVLKEGNQSSEQPNIRNIITAHYTGKTINGKKFDSSRGRAPLACRLCDLINGWIIALQQMHIGDKWELYIPAEMGYGRFSQPGIPGGSTLIFEIELLGIA